MYHLLESIVCLGWPSRNSNTYIILLNLPIYSLFLCGVMVCRVPQLCSRSIHNGSRRAWRETVIR